MQEGPPELIAINHDDYHAKYIGIASDGSQFFLTSLFEPAIGGSPGCEYVALFKFDPAGRLIDSRIENFGPRDQMDEGARTALRDRWLEELGEVNFERIEVAPFSVEKFGTSFGLIVREPEDEDDEWAVELQPGDFMAFFEPWDSGDYDT